MTPRDPTIQPTRQVTTQPSGQPVAEQENRLTRLRAGLAIWGPLAAMVLAALALYPVLGEFMAALEHYLAMSELYQLSRQVERQQGEQRAAIRTYQDFVDEMEHLTTRLGEFRLRPDQWNEYTVDIRDRLVDVDTMNRMLDHARNGLDYYFQPSLLDMNADLQLNVKSTLAKDLQEQIKKEKLEPGAKIILTLAGKFVVAVAP